MGRSCSICTHDDRAGIEAAYQMGSMRAAAQMFGVSATAVRRHRDNCTPPTAALTNGSGPPSASVLEQKVNEGFDRMEALEAQLASILQNARAVGDTKTALAAIKGFASVRAELRQNLALLARHADTSDEERRDFLASPAWASVKAMIEDALASYPQARAAVDARLLEFDSEH
jgi:hypothetical protein